MLTRRGFFAWLLGVLGLTMFGMPAARQVAAMPAVDKTANAQPIQDDPLQLYVDGMLMPPSGSVYIGDAWRLVLPPGKLYSKHDHEQLFPGQPVPQRHQLIFEPTVCLTNAEHARLEAYAKPFGITIQKGCES